MKDEEVDDHDDDETKSIKRTWSCPSSSFDFPVAARLRHHLCAICLNGRGLFAGWSKNRPVATETERLDWLMPLRRQQICPLLVGGSRPRRNGRRADATGRPTDNSSGPQRGASFKSSRSQGGVTRGRV
jgi:hypothetical protein